MRAQGLGDWKDAFSGLLTQAADVYAEKERFKMQQAQEAARRQYELAQSAPQMLAAGVPGGGTGLLLGLAAVAALLFLSKGRR